jgi:hypothetical protein
MQLYKSRDFSEYFQDTFAFIKQNGRHLFKHFIIINGIPLMILLVLGYFFSKFYGDIFSEGMVNGNSSAIDSYINENYGGFSLLIITFVIIAFLAGMIWYAFVPFYLKLYQEKNGINFSSSDIMNCYKTHLGKIFIFFICGLLLTLPMLVGVSVLLLILAITIIGFLAMPMVIGALSLLYQGALMEYIDDQRGIWGSFMYSWKLMRSKFWAAIGCVGLFYLMSYVIQNVIAIIPYAFGMVSLFTEIETNTTPDNTAIQKTITVMMLAIFLLTFFVSSLLNIILQINQGVVYYSLKEDIENINTKSAIDLIGSSE